MDDLITAAADSLDSLASSIVGSYQVTDHTFAEIWPGWNMPQITFPELADRPSRVASQIRMLPQKSVSEHLKALLTAIPPRVRLIESNSIPNLPSGNAPIVVPIINDLCEMIQFALPVPPPAPASVDWKAAETQKLLPPDLLRRLRAIESSLKQVEPRTATVAEDVRVLREARRAAEELPTTLQDLAEKNEAIESFFLQARGLRDDIEGFSIESGESLARLNLDKSEAALVLNKVNEAYRAATTQGLAAAFSKKAVNLHWTLFFWIIGLAASLGVGAWIAHLRFTGMDTLLKTPNIPTDRLWIQAVLAVLSIGGPVWFAWIATKQIGQRFRMAEDYAYKATVAKAYEGYRLEAMNVDSGLASRLFATAIERLEEAPLRLVEQGSHGSPMHELMDSAVFRRAASAFPELMDITSEFGRKAFKAVQPTRGTSDIDPTD